MIIDLILDRRDDIRIDGVDFYNAHDFYFRCLRYNSVFNGIADDILSALDSGTEQDVKQALCRYITDNEYNPQICDFINSVQWIDSPY